MTDDAGSHVGRLSPDGNWRWDGFAWTPASAGSAHPAPAWASLRVTAQASWWVVAAVIVAGLAADQSLRVGAFGLGATLALACLALALVLVGRVQRFEARVLAGAAALFAAWLSLRASPWLLWPDLAAGLILLGAAASIAQRGSLLNIGMADASARGFQATLHWVAGGPWAMSIWLLEGPPWHGLTALVKIADKLLPSRADRRSRPPFLARLAGRCLGRSGGHLRQRH